MSIDNIPAGKDFPNDFNAIIEIPAEGGSIKYEMDKDSGLVVVDRFMPVSMHYPCNYGFVPQTLADDGDPADVLVITPFPVHPGVMMSARPIGLLKMTDEAGQDSKILAVPTKKACMQLADVEDLKDVSQLMLDKIEHFFENYKKLEPNKWVKIDGWEGKDAAIKELLDSQKRYNG